jgi:hypothetical protein
MATNPLPINNFRSITSTLASGSNLIYQEDLDISAILLSAAITNVTNTTQVVTVDVLKSGSLQGHSLIYSASIPVGEALNPFPGKVILERNDSLVIKTPVSGALHIVLSVLENANS